MNLLAHTVLSKDSEKILVGNFIADFVRGKQYLHFEEEIKQGILLHRKIDHFTDSHPCVKQSALRLQKDFGKYAPVLVDIFYDHFLAIHFQVLTQKDLEKHALQTYQILEAHLRVLPNAIQNFLPNMTQQNWLVRYADLDGIHRALQGINRRAQFANHLDSAIENLKNDFNAFEDDFLGFFPEIWKYVQQTKV